MNLVTVANPPFSLRAINLIESYRRFAPSGRVLFCHFGGLSEKFISTVTDHYGGQVVFSEVEESCAHAHHPRFYFFKTYALHAAMKLREPFVYLDAASAILAPTTELEQLLRERERVFVQYPRIDFFRNERWTAAPCLRRMGFEEERFRTAHIYFAGFQAYLPTPENEAFIEEMFQLMHDPEVAGPSNWRQDPDGNGVCQAHRNDQSVLSLLIERNGWHQPFERERFVRYGDVPTLEAFTPEVLAGAEGLPRAIVARYNREDLVPPELKASLWREVADIETLRSLAEGHERWARQAEEMLAAERENTATLRERVEGLESTLAEYHRRAPGLRRALGRSAVAPTEPVKLDVCVCTHDPRRDVLEVTLRAIAGQVATGAFEVLLVDNASTPPLGPEVLEPLHRAGIPARLTREEQRGIARARLHAIQATSGDWILFVDDDNELSPDFVAEGLQFIGEHPEVGCFGGKLLLAEGLRPPRWARAFLPYLGIKDAGEGVITGTGERWGDWEPPTAGAFVRRDLLDAYRARVEQDPRILQLGRNGRDGLGSCEDSLIARQAFQLGVLNAYDPKLSLKHHLDPARFRLGYLLRLMEGYGRSHVLLEDLLRDSSKSTETPPEYVDSRKFMRKMLREFDRGRKRSIAYGLGLVAYHRSARRAYFQREGRDA